MDNLTFGSDAPPPDGFSAASRVADLCERTCAFYLLRSGAVVETVAVDDLRGWAAGEAFTVSGRPDLPTGLAEGIYRLGIWMPDLSPSIRSRSEYAVRFANDGVWDQASGINDLGVFVVSDAAVGTSEEGQSFSFTPTM